MATIPKSNAIHSTGHLKNAIKYIQRDDKTNFKLYCDGINVSTNPHLAFEQFSTIQKIYEKDTYNEKEKEKIIAHHFTQNFHKDENITPELAMKIASETVKKHFGEGYQILLATHVDRDFIHTHIIVNSISTAGEKYHAKGETLSAFRKTSDEVCKSYGLSTLDFSKHKRRKRTLTYNRWRDKQKGISWKDRIKTDIDKSIIKSGNMEELFQKLDKLNYECKFFKNAKGEKYFGIRDKKFKKSYFANTKNFGAGYEIKDIEEKLNNKNLIELPNDEVIEEAKVITIKVYSQQNIKLKYKSTISILVDLIMNKNVIKPFKYYKQYPYSVNNDYHVQTLANQLNFLDKKNINSHEDLKNEKDKMKIFKEDVTEKVNKLTKMRTTHKALIRDFETFELLKNKKIITKDEKQTLIKLQQKLNEYDIKKIENNLNLIESNIEKVKPVFEKLGSDLKMIDEIETTLKDIENESYIDKAKIDDEKNVTERTLQTNENKEFDRD